MLNEWWLLDNVVREMGDGNNALFWKDPWLGGSSFDISFSRLFELTNNKLITVADMNSLGWGVS